MVLPSNASTINNNASLFSGYFLHPCENLIKPKNLVLPNRIEEKVGFVEDKGIQRLTKFRTFFE